MRNELSYEQILTMLNDNWRPSKAGAWIIGLCKIVELKKDLIRYLNNHPTYCEQVIINLTILNSEDGNKAINEYLSNQLLDMLNKEKSNFLTLLEELENVDLGFDNVMKTIIKANNTK
ncbi:MAG: hypothetical protein ACI8ZM_004759 [Crocinitomix sp.]